MAGSSCPRPCQADHFGEAWNFERRIDRHHPFSYGTSRRGTMATRSVRAPLLRVALREIGHGRRLPAFMEERGCRPPEPVRSDRHPVMAPVAVEVPYSQLSDLGGG